MAFFAESLTGVPIQPAVVQWIAVPPSKTKGDPKITRIGITLLPNYLNVLPLHFY